MFALSQDGSGCKWQKRGPQLIKQSFLASELATSTKCAQACHRRSWCSGAVLCRNHLFSSLTDAALWVICKQVKVKKINVEVLVWPGYRWSVVWRAAGCLYRVSDMMRSSFPTLHQSAAHPSLQTQSVRNKPPQFIVVFFFFRAARQAKNIIFKAQRHSFNE